MEKMPEEPKPGVSKKRVIEESSSSGEEIEEIDPSCITDELLQKYASEKETGQYVPINEGVGKKRSKRKQASMSLSKI